MGVIKFTIPRLNGKSNPIIRQLNRYGLVVIDNLYSQDYCEKIIQDIDKALIEKADEVWVDEFDSDHSVFGIEMFSLGSRRFADDI